MEKLPLKKLSLATGLKIFLLPLLAFLGFLSFLWGAPERPLIIILLQIGGVISIGWLLFVLIKFLAPKGKHLRLIQIVRLLILVQIVLYFLALFDIWTF